MYDEHGNPLTSTLAEYAMPSAAEFPSSTPSTPRRPRPCNPLGAKGIGESGTIGSMPAVQNAVIDAVSHLGVRHIEMPCSPEKVWRAIQTAGDGGDTVGWREPPAVFASLLPREPAPCACRRRCRDLVLARSRSRCTSRSDLDGRSRALDWPGWCRSGKTAGAALETLAAAERCRSHRPRRGGVRCRSGRSPQGGRGAQRFGGHGLRRTRAHRDGRQQAADDGQGAGAVGVAPSVVGRVCGRRGRRAGRAPQGTARGGRDRDKIVEHVVQAEAGYARKLGIRRKPPAIDDTAAIDDELRSSTCSPPLVG